jgi:hypothetical protein
MGQVDGDFGFPCGQDGGAIPGSRPVEGIEATGIGVFLYFETVKNFDVYVNPNSINRLKSLHPKESVEFPAISA